MSSKNLSYRERASFTHNPVAKRLFSLMDAKESNLCVAADLTRKEALLELADRIGPHIVLLKTHIDILEDFDAEVIKKLMALSLKHDFLLFEDRKFADIGNTVGQQYGKGIYRMVEWADIINAHPLVGPGIIRGLQEEAGNRERGLLLLAQMSAKDNLITRQYTKQTVLLAEQHRPFVMGFICTEKISSDPGMIHMTPGIGLQEKGDSLGQQYQTPEEAIAKGTDIIIVGRGIYKDPSPQTVAERYRTLAFKAYRNRF